jgi:TatA/E family protein of Tat protein translocase
MPFGLGIGELTLVFGIVLLVFGAKRLPEVAGGMGKGIRDFKRALNGMDEETLQANPPLVQAASPEAETKQLP